MISGVKAVTKWVALASGLTLAKRSLSSVGTLQVQVIIEATRSTSWRQARQMAWSASTTGARRRWSRDWTTCIDRPAWMLPFTLSFRLLSPPVPGTTLLQCYTKRHSHTVAPSEQNRRLWLTATRPTRRKHYFMSSRRYQPTMFCCSFERATVWIVQAPLVT